MTAEEKESVNVEQIMKQIKEEVAKNGPYDEILSFESIPIKPEHAETEISISDVKKQMGEKLEDLVIPPVLPLSNEGFLKKIYKKAVTKVVRCATFPYAVKLTETNYKLKESLELAVQMIEQQQKQIELLSERLKKMEGKTDGR